MLKCDCSNRAPVERGPRTGTLTGLGQRSISAAAEMVTSSGSTGSGSGKTSLLRNLFQTQNLDWGEGPGSGAEDHEDPREEGIIV